MTKRQAMKLTEQPFSVQAIVVAAAGYLAWSAFGDVVTHHRNATQHPVTTVEQHTRELNGLGPKLDSIVATLRSLEDDRIRREEAAKREAIEREKDRQRFWLEQRKKDRQRLEAIEQRLPEHEENER